MATQKRSALDESLVNMVEDVTSKEARIAGGVATDADLAEMQIEREEKIALTIRERQVPRPIAIIMVDTGYSKGTANRIYADNQKRERLAREAAQATQQAKSAKQPASASA